MDVFATRRGPWRPHRGRRGGRRFHHRGTENTKICNGEEDLLEGLSVFEPTCKFGLFVVVCVGMYCSGQASRTRRRACPWPPKDTFASSCASVVKFPLRVLSPP